MHCRLQIQAAHLEYTFVWQISVEIKLTVGIEYYERATFILSVIFTTMHFNICSTLVCVFGVSIVDNNTQSAEGHDKN